MRNKFTFLWFLLLCAFLVTGCENMQKERTVVSEQVIISDVNPNGNSELALLMRALFEDADSLRLLIASGEGNINQEFVEMIRQSHEAAPTKPTMKPAEFDAFNQLLLNDATALLNADTATIEKFNKMVDRCIDCHNTVCPGPTKRIKKLYIQ